MGGAFTAVSDDENSAFWNPAGLGDLNGNSLTWSQNHLTFDARDYLVNLVVHPFSIPASFALSWTQSSLDNVANTKVVTDGNGNPEIDPTTNLPLQQILDYYTQDTSQFFVSAGVALGEHISVGGSLVGTSINGGDGLDNSISGNLGALFIFQELRIGAEAIGLGDYLFSEADGTISVQNPFWKVGLAYTWDKILGDLDVYYFPDISTPAQFYGGLEYPIFEELAVRVGVNPSGASAGVSLRAKKIVLEYAFVPGSSIDANRISLRVEF